MDLSIWSMHSRFVRYLYWGAWLVGGPVDGPSARRDASQRQLHGDGPGRLLCGGRTHRLPTVHNRARYAWTLQCPLLSPHINV